MMETQKGLVRDADGEGADWLVLFGIFACVPDKLFTHGRVVQALLADAICGGGCVAEGPHVSDISCGWQARFSKLDAIAGSDGKVRVEAQIL